MVRQAAREASILILAAVAVALIVYAIRPDKIGSQPDTVQGDSGQLVSVENGPAEIALTDARRLFDDKQAVFADARHPADYAAGHIQGAINLYAPDPDDWLADLLVRVAPQTAIITYCDGADCHLATQLAELLALNGFTNVRYLRNGWTRWRESGYPAAAAEESGGAPVDKDPP